jgi:hypothetical protein
METKNFAVGDLVQWNGSAPPSRPRMYVGQIVEVRENSYLIVDNEWFATSEVSKKRVFAADKEQA